MRLNETFLTELFIMTTQDSTELLNQLNNTQDAREIKLLTKKITINNTLIREIIKYRKLLKDANI